jgi:protein TonB
MTQQRMKPTPPSRTARKPAGLALPAGVYIALLFVAFVIGVRAGSGPSRSAKPQASAPVAIAEAPPVPKTAEPLTPPPTEPKRVEPPSPKPLPTVKAPEPKKLVETVMPAKPPERPKPQPKPTAVRAVSFAAQVLPIFKDKCIACHGDPTIKGGLDLRTLAAIKKGGENGAGTVAGKPDDSTIWMQIADGNMPPPKKPKLTDTEKKLIHDWIASGAK